MQPLARAKHNPLDLVINPACSFEVDGRRVRGQVVQVRLEEPEGEQRAINGFFAQVEQELFERHGLVVHAYEEVA
jgi:hypothetical protein